MDADPSRRVAVAAGDAMPRPATWYFDFISPFAYLQFKAMAALRPRLALTPRPILFAALLDHYGHKGPAEIPQKRRFTYRFVQWQADRVGVPLRFPPEHPFNPLAALRLAVAGHCDWALIDAIFERIWVHGQRSDRASDFSELAARFGIADVEMALADAGVKSALRANTEAAIAAGVFGVPTVAVDGELYWGQDATPMLLDHLDAKPVFSSVAMQRIDALPAAVERKPS
jgi:2-hydroxychromene-2-carboxylate isomerase